MAFDTLGLSPSILKAIAEKGYSEPSPIQAKAVPAVLTGRDVMAASQTGTGKTAGFTLPLLEKLSTGPTVKGNQVRALVLTPTRELAAQVADSITTYGKYLQLKSTVVFGGVKINPQMMKLRGGTDILVATPGRLLDLYQQNAVRFNQLEVLVLDEADRMLDMGFIHDIRKIMALLPAKRQNLMFSATFSDEIRELAKGIIHDPIEVSVAPANTTAERVTQSIIPVDSKRKSQLLIKLIKERRWFQVLVFSRTKHGANRIATRLEKAGINAVAIHGNKSQNARTRALADFKDNKINVLVATDIAARGIDIAQLPHVVNFDLPHVPEDYVHRIGRTARANNEGEAISLVCADELKQLKDIQRLIKEVLPREMVAGFEPTTPLPEIELDTRPKRIKKPKKPKSAVGERSMAQPQNTAKKPSAQQHAAKQHATKQNTAKQNTNKPSPAKKQPRKRPVKNNAASPQKSPASKASPWGKR